MMDLMEEAIIYATVLHQGKLRKRNRVPYILHPLEVAQILSTMTDDRETITAGILHDVVENAGGTPEEIRSRFGDRVALLVDSVTEDLIPGEDRAKSWKRRKEQSLENLKTTEDIGVKMLWLADKLANVRSLARDYSENGESIWEHFHQKDPSMIRWYYRTVAEYVELDLNRTGAYKELIKHINYLWPGTFASDKTQYRKYKSVSVEGCRLLGSGKKGKVYRYDDELILKVYNHNNTYADVEREIAQSRRAFVLGIPTAISFGIVSVGERYGAMYELVDAETLSTYIAGNPSGLDYYAEVMADLARTIHGTEAEEDDRFPDARDRFRAYITNGLARSDRKLARACTRLIDAMPDTRRLIHGDYHTSNVFLQNSEALLIDMDRLATGDPIFELGNLYMYYAIHEREDPDAADPYLGLPYGVCGRFFRLFLKHYLQTEDDARIREVTDQAALLGLVRRLSHTWKAGELTQEQQCEADALVGEIRKLLERVDSLGVAEQDGTGAEHAGEAQPRSH